MTDSREWCTDILLAVAHKNNSWWVHACAHLSPKNERVQVCNTHNNSFASLVECWAHDLITLFHKYTIAIRMKYASFSLSFHCHWISPFWRLHALPSCVVVLSVRVCTPNSGVLATMSVARYLCACLLSTSLSVHTHFQKKDLEFSQTLKYVWLLLTLTDLLLLLFHIPFIDYELRMFFFPSRSRILLYP